MAKAPAHFYSLGDSESVQHLQRGRRIRRLKERGILRARNRWIVSGGVTVGFAVLLWLSWMLVDQSYHPVVERGLDDAKVESLLARQRAARGGEEPIVVPTGLFIQSLKFATANDVTVSGYVWQVYEDHLPSDLSRGIVLPEAVDSAATGVMEPAYCRPSKNVDLGRLLALIPRDLDECVTRGQNVVIGWYFESTLRQQFRYEDYPLDHKVVWMRLWHRDFDRNVVLVPHLEAYDEVGSNDTFGLDASIVLGGWDLGATYFDYLPSSYHTNFGIENYVGKSEFPELRFNIVLKRRFIDALIVNLVPLFLVAALLFSMVMLATADEKLAMLHGFNTATVFGACSALFFVVLLAHVQLRQLFSGQGLVYMEYFYLLMYAIILLVAVAIYHFSERVARDSGAARLTQCTWLKITYWPVLLGAALLMTGMHFLLGSSP